MKRIFLFVLTNFAIIAVLTILAQVLGLDRWLAAHGQGLGPLLVLSSLFGFGGAFISLLISKWMAKRAMGVRVIEQPSTDSEHWLVGTVRKLAEQAGIGMPEVGVFDSPQPNAFATGARRDHALVAVSTGLLRSMSQEEITAVLGHEITHVANGDMITMTLISGVVNTFVILLSRVIGSLVDRALSRDGERGGGIGYFVSVFVAQMVLGFFANMIVMWFSRRREFRADAGGGKLAGNRSMIAALERLRAAHGGPLPQQLAAFGISGGEGSGFQRLFMSHPPLEERIAALQAQG
jgi:heat shock protein HtpX